jgi:aspartyl-tRNA(Asn)/glutamyl-tRNA(Gln) amidotransferase subunit C
MSGASPNPPLSADHVRAIARLACLALPDDRITGYAHDLAGVLGYVDRLRSLDLGTVEPMTTPLDVTNRLDDDVPGPVLGVDRVMAIAPGSMPPFISVPKVLDSGGSA